MGFAYLEIPSIIYELKPFEDLGRKERKTHIMCISKTIKQKTKGPNRNTHWGPGSCTHTHTFVSNNGFGLHRMQAQKSKSWKSKRKFALFDPQSVWGLKLAIVYVLHITVDNMFGPK